eukprot:scaffold88705_cov27-Tisochrysis_lutea.AAC.2
MRAPDTAGLTTPCSVASTTLSPGGALCGAPAGASPHEVDNLLPSSREGPCSGAAEAPCRAEDSGTFGPSGRVCGTAVRTTGSSGARTSGSNRAAHSCGLGGGKEPGTSQPVTPSHRGVGVAALPRNRVASAHAAAPLNELPCAEARGAEPGRVGRRRPLSPELLAHGDHSRCRGAPSGGGGRGAQGLTALGCSVCERGLLSSAKLAMALLCDSSRSVLALSSSGRASREARRVLTARPAARALHRRRAESSSWRRASASAIDVCQ